jgi:hypothetical protein
MGKVDKKIAKKEPKKMKTLGVDLRMRAALKGRSKKTKSLTFSQWIDQYVKVTNGNPV